MISSLTPEEKKAWDRDMARYIRRQKRHNRYESFMNAAGLILLALFIMGCVFFLLSCGRTKVKAFNPDGHYVDSLLHDDHQVPEFITMDTGTVIDHGSYIEVRYKHVAVFTEKPPRRVGMAGENPAGENGFDTAQHKKTNNQ